MAVMAPKPISGSRRLRGNFRFARDPTRNPDQPIPVVGAIVYR
jgi:hypothetical protein